jgi:hypothetical protein
MRKAIQLTGISIFIVIIIKSGIIVPWAKNAVVTEHQWGSWM